MARTCAVWRAVAVGLFAALFVAGCPSSEPAGLTGSAADRPGELAEEDVIRVLGIAVEADAVDPESTPSSDDEARFFGEDEALYADVSPEAVEITEESIINEIETEFGAEPAAMGMLAGRFWSDLPDSTSDESGGVFRGRWLSADGELRGYVRGGYHPLPPGALPMELEGGGRFHGRYIDTEGHFRGFLRGRYGHAPSGRGVFFGRWLDRSFRLVGVLKGHWIDEAESDGGWFAGRWAAFNVCDEAASLPEVETPGLSEAELIELDALEIDDVALEPMDRPLTAKPNGLADEVDVRAGEPPPCVEFDRPHGFLRGWHVPFPSDDEREGGVFRGRYLNADGEPMGRLRGRWDDAPDRPGGPFFGVWFGADLDGDE